MNSVNPIRNVLKHAFGRLPFVNTAARRILSAGGSVFMLHRVLPKIEECYEPEMVTSKEAFADFLDWLNENYRVVPLDLLVSQRATTIDRKKPACAITFDDGWLDNFIHAFPLLKASNVPATIFLPVRFIGTSRRFWQERLSFCLGKVRPLELRGALIEESARFFPWFPPAYDCLSHNGQLKRFLMTRPSEEAEEFVHHLAETARLDVVPSDRAFMNWDEVREMQAMGISFGSHTLNHALLTNTEPAKAIQEIRESRQELEERIGDKVTAFSYPWGATSLLTKEAVLRAGYDYAVTTRPGLIHSAVDRWLIPRLAVSDPILREGSTRFAPNKARLWFAKNVLQSTFIDRVSPNPTKSYDRIKIAFIIDQIDGWEGGTESQLRVLIQALDDRYFESALLCIYRFPEVALDTFPCPVHFVCVNELYRRFAPLRLLRLVQLLRKIKPQITQTYFPEANSLGICSAKLARVPIIIGTTRNTTHSKSAVLRFASRISNKLANRWQCNSRSVWNFEIEKVHSSPAGMEILPNAVNPPRLLSTPAAQTTALREQFTVQGPLIVSVANLRPVKDLLTLIEAAAHVHKHLAGAQFLLLGQGPMYADLQKRIAQLKLTHVVRLTGTQSDVYPYLAAADIGVLTSVSEGSSNSLLEYMAMGLPAVVSDIPANRDLVEQVFFTTGNSKNLAANLIELWGDAALRFDMSRRYRELASEYDLKACKQRAESFYHRLVAELTQGPR